VRGETVGLDSSLPFPCTVQAFVGCGGICICGRDEDKLKKYIWKKMWKRINYFQEEENKDDKEGVV
jgi:hypothetical protein